MLHAECERRGNRIQVPTIAVRAWNTPIDHSLREHEQDDEGLEEAGRQVAVGCTDDDGSCRRPSAHLAGGSLPRSGCRHQEEQEEIEMPYTVSGTDIRGLNTAKRSTPELALKKARDLIANACYDVRITTPEGRTYHSAEFSDLPRLPWHDGQPTSMRPPARPPCPPVGESGETSRGGSLLPKKPA
jgi:hypothetical protein